MSERELRGLAAAGGVAVGRALVVREAEPEAGSGGPGEAARAVEALERVAEELGGTAERLRGMGMGDEAEILETNRLMAQDPALLEKVRELAAGMPATGAVKAAAEHHAQLLAEIPDPLFAARAADARQLGRRAARLLGGRPVTLDTSEPSILVGRDLGPADVAELDLGGGRICGIALAEGAATSHAAIMARALGVPMVVALGDEVLAAEGGEDVVLDGDAGSITFAPGGDALDRARSAVRRRQATRHELARSRGLPSTTSDGRHVRLLCNAATAAEARAGLYAGAEGVGLLRTELAFLEAPAWPTEDEHAGALAPVLSALAGRLATVRTLDFGADKTPPFLAGVAERGIALSLLYPDALAAQLRAILRTAAGSELRIMVPLVGNAEELRVARTLLERSAAEVGWEGEVPALGAMVETPEAVARIDEIASEADFLSIGTNDLVQYTLGLDRELPLASARAAADPAVLKLVSEVARGAERAGLKVEICGEAACELPLVVLFVGLGIGELSVAPARVDDVRATVRGITSSAAEAAAADALAAGTAEQALARAEAVLLRETGDESDELLDSLGGALA